MSLQGSEQTLQDNEGEARLQRLLEECRGLLRAAEPDDPEASELLAQQLSKLVGETLLTLDRPRKAELLKLLFEAN